MIGIAGLFENNIIESLKNELPIQNPDNKNAALQEVIGAIEDLNLLQQPQNADNLKADDWSSDWAQRIRLNKKGELNDELVKLIVKGRERGWLNEKMDAFVGGTMLHSVAKRDTCDEYIPELIEQGVNPLVRDDLFGNTALIWAIANANNTTAMKMLECSSLGIDAQCDLGNSALHLAVGKGYIDFSDDGRNLLYSNLQIVQCMIKKKCNVNLKNRDGNTALHFACLRRDYAMIQELVAAGADQSILNEKEKSPQDYLLQANYVEANAIIDDAVHVFRPFEKEHGDPSNLKLCQQIFMNQIK